MSKAEQEEEEAMLDCKKSAYSIDELFTLIGIGKYHLIIQIILLLTLIPVGMQTLMVHFSAQQPAWQCNRNSTACNISGIVSSVKKEYTSRCGMPRKEWHYLEPEDASIITQFNLDCGRESDVNWLFTLFFIFGQIGTVATGYLSDKFGRFPPFFVNLLVTILVPFLGSFAPSFWIFAVSRCITGLSVGGLSPIVFVISSETASPKHRPIMSVAMYIISYPLGMVMLAYQAYALQSWKHLMMVSTLPYLALVPFCWFVPETVRWLRQSNKVSKMKKTLHRMAKWNNVRLPPDFEVEGKDDSTTAARPNPLDLVNTRKMCYRTVALCFSVFSCSLISLGLTLATDDFGEDPYMSFALSGVAEIPGGILAIVLCMRFGRKYPTTITYLIGGVFTALISVTRYMSLGQATNPVRLTFGLLAILFNTTAFDAVYVWAVELFPTVIRTEAVACLEASLRLGGAVAPWIAKWLLKFHPALPYITMGCVAVISTVILSFLPETIDNDTLEDMKDLDKPRAIREKSAAGKEPLQQNV